MDGAIFQKMSVFEQLAREQVDVVQKPLRAVIARCTLKFFQDVSGLLAVGTLPPDDPRLAIALPRFGVAFVASSAFYVTITRLTASPRSLRLTKVTRAALVALLPRITWFTFADELIWLVQLDALFGEVFFGRWARARFAFAERCHRVAVEAFRAFFAVPSSCVGFAIRTEASFSVANIGSAVAFARPGLSNKSVYDDRAINGRRGIISKKSNTGILARRRIILAWTFAYFDPFGQGRRVPSHFDRRVQDPILQNEAFELGEVSGFDENVLDVL